MEQADKICSIEIRRGVIRLVSIEMQLTYGGLIEGAPTASFNDALIEELRKRRTPAYVVPPERTVGPQPTDPWDEPLETLPPVRCVGMFDGPPTPRAVGDRWRTFLYVIWFQEPSDQIVHPRAAAQMYDMPWDDLARDLTFDDL